MMFVLKVALISCFTTQVSAFQRTRQLKDPAGSLNAGILLQTGLSLSSQPDEIDAAVTSATREIQIQYGENPSQKDELIASIVKNALTTVNITLKEAGSSPLKMVTTAATDTFKSAAESIDSVRGKAKGHGEINQTAVAASVAILDQQLKNLTAKQQQAEDVSASVSSRIESAISQKVNETVESVAAKVFSPTTVSTVITKSNASEARPSFGDAVAAASAAAGEKTTLKVDQKAKEKNETSTGATEETKSFGAVVADAAKAATDIEEKVVQKAEVPTTTSSQATLGAAAAIAAKAATAVESKGIKIPTATEAEEKEKETTSWAPEVSKTFGDAVGTAAEIAAEKAKEVVKSASTTSQAVANVSFSTEVAKDNVSSVAAAAAKAVTAAEEKAREGLKTASNVAEATHQKLADAVAQVVNVTADRTAVSTSEKVSGDIQDALHIVTKTWTNITEAALRKSVEDTKLNILNASELLDKLDQASSKVLDAQSNAAAAKIVKERAEQRLADLANQTIVQSNETLVALNGKDGIADVDKIIASSAAAQTSAKEAAELAKQADAAKRIYDQQVEQGEKARHEELSIAVQMSRQLNNIIESSANGIKAVSEEVDATELRGKALNITVEGSNDAFLARIMSNESVQRTSEALNQTVAVLDNIKEKASDYTQAKANDLIDQLNDAAQKTSEVVSGTVQQAQRVADVLKNQLGVGAKSEDSTDTTVDRRPLAIQTNGFSETPVLAGIAVLVALLLALICCTSMAKM
jgi:hypothetical protein